MGTCLKRWYPGYDFPQIEELYLMQINGVDPSLAERTQNLRWLHIIDSMIGKNHGLSKTIAKLKKIESVCLRKCSFSPKEIVDIIKTNGTLTEIKLEVPPRYLLKTLIELLVKPSNQIKTTENLVVLRIIVPKPDVS